MHFSEFRTWFDSHFLDLVIQKGAEFTTLGTSKDMKPIVAYISTIAQDGKRFRPFLLYCASGLTAHDRDRHFLLFASIELLHVFALIHDDIMDAADTRHDVLCAHKQFAHLYGDATANSIGLLLGDIVFAWAYECLFTYLQLFPEFRDRITEEYTRLVREVMHGQLLDILSPVQPSLDEKAIIEKMTLKTARYSFVQPMRIGFIVSGDNAADQSFAETFGVSIGIAFQLQDDLLDTLPSVQTGKTRFVDMRSGQQTLFSWYMQNEAHDTDRETFLQMFGTKDMSPDMEAMLADLFESSGALTYVRAQSEQYFADAAKAIQYNRSDDVMLWQDILSLVQHRKK